MIFLLFFGIIIIYRKKGGIYLSYNADSIKIKDFLNACRDTPSMYLGDDRENGIFNAFLELLNNACDEAIMKRGNIITVDMEDDILEIEDHGRGIPHGPNEDYEEVLIELFTKSHSSGKFDTSNYKKVRGLHGKTLNVNAVIKFF